MNETASKVTAPERMVSLSYRVREGKKNELLQFLARAIPFYERPGDIQVTLYENLDDPGLFLELVAYGTVGSYEEDQERVRNSHEYGAVLDEWHELIEGSLNVGILKRIDPCAPLTVSHTHPAVSPGLVIESAAFNDYAAIVGLLTENNLPVPDNNDQPVHFLVARQKEQIVACLGWELYGFRAFLRSLSVGKNRQRQGIGSLLVRAALSRLSTIGVSEFYLLTSEAANFVERFGFTAIDRCSLPKSIKASRQVESDCYAASKCMQLQLSIS